MKKLRLVIAFLAAGAVMNFSSCSKDDDNTTNTPPTATTNEASIDGVTVTKTSDPIMSDKIAVLETIAGKFETYFAEKPTESGTYTVKSAFTAAKGLADLKEVILVFTDKVSQNMYTSNTSGTASVVIKDGKISIDIKNVDVCTGSTCKKVSVKYDFAYTPPAVNPDPINPNPTTDLSPNEFKVGSKVYKTLDNPQWHGNNGYLGSASQLGSESFKAIFSKANPASGTYKIVNVANSLSTVSDGEIGISLTIGYLPKAITTNTGKATVTNEKGQLTIIISDVTIGNDKFSAHYVIGDKNKHIFADGNLLNPMYGEAISEIEYNNVYKTRIKTYGSSTSASVSWNFVFYFGATGLNDGSYTSIGSPSLLQNVPAGSVYLIADKGFLQYKSTATSGTVTVQGKKIIFKDFVITTSDSQTVKITGEYQF